MPIIIDLASAKAKHEVHSVISVAFGFPEYYGSNWDAFDECIRDYPPKECIEIRGLDALASRLPREAELLRACLAAYKEEQPDFELHIR